MPDCTISRKNIGKSKCTRLPSLPKYMITTPNSFFLTPVQVATPAALKTALQDAIVASRDARIYLWPKFTMFEDQSEEAIYVQTALGSRKVRDGQYRFRFGVSKDLCVHKAMFSHSTFGEGRFIMVDFNNRLLMTVDSSGNYRGLTMDMLNTEKLKIGDGSVITETPIFVSLNDNLELDASGELLDAGTIITELEPLTDVVIASAGTLSTTVITVSVKNECDGTPVSGLLLADFAVKTSPGGVSQTPTAVTEPAGDGVYVLTKSTNWTPGLTSVSLRDASLLTLKAYEVQTPLIVTVP